MVAATGVGSGTIWNEQDLFATREEAQAFCDESNSTLKQDDPGAELLPQLVSVRNYEFNEE